MGFARKITLGIIGVLLLVSALIGFFSYQTAFRQVEEAVGIETVGCANITTGLVDPGVIEQLAQGDTSGLDALEERLNWTVAHKPLFKEVFILSLDGKILAADQNIKQRGYQAGDEFYFNPADRDMIIQMKHSVYTKIYTYDGTNLLTGYGPIYKDHDPTKEIVGLMAINFDASIIHERVWDILTLPFIIGGIVFLLAIMAVYLFIHRMIRPIEKLSRQVNLVAQGDLSVEPLSLSSKDEVGTLSRDFGNMTVSLRQLITEVNEMSMQVASSSQQLSASAEETGKASEQTVFITQELAAGAEKQLQNLEQSSAALQEMSAFISQIVDKADNVSEEARISAAAAKEGVSSIRLGMRQMNTIEGKIAALSSSIQQLGSHSKEIRNILDIITEIAAETNLLAINAAIEAARAGEQGSGFAVVASSVRKLAERSAASAQQIASLITFIIDQMDTTAETMEETSREVHLGAELVGNAGNSFEEIQQSTKNSAEAAGNVSETVRQLSANSKLLVEAMAQLVEVANSTVDGTQTMSAASQEQLAAMQEVDASAAFLSGLSEKLQSQIDRFKV
ncbi:methyl-accepting chemotaxis protein [Paenibacillus sp. M1]|uniref:Methyl-accepting chemotaxis protein n=1 Tax=Paenibacillus haidiansis TaxID=1574488 RepID=A0ABU7VW41_9BACL